MGLETVKETDTCTVIKVSGRFDFACHSDFRAAYAGMPDGTEYVVNMAEAAYVDSAALGMLLLLREHVQLQGGRVTITHCRGPAYDVLQVANFHRLFKITQ